MIYIYKSELFANCFELIEKRFLFFLPGKNLLNFGVILPQNIRKIILFSSFL